MAEVVMNGILDAETHHYFHICFFSDTEGPDLENPDRYIFIPKPVCRILDTNTISILDWYVNKKKLHRYVKGRRTRPSRRGTSPSSSRNHADLFRSKPLNRQRRNMT